jgi:hypothetical protein
VYYQNKLVIQNAKLVDWHVSYRVQKASVIVMQLGCPEYSQAAVVAVTEPQIKELEENGKTIGFVLEQSFQSEQWPQPCNYKLYSTL